MEETAQTKLLTAYSNVRAMQLNFDRKITAQMYLGYSDLKSAEARALQMLRGVADGIWADATTALKKVDAMIDAHNGWFAFHQVANKPEDFGKLVGNGFLRLRTNHARKLAGQPWASYQHHVVVTANGMQQNLSQLGTAHGDLLDTQHKLLMAMELMFDADKVDQALEEATGRAEARRKAAKTMATLKNRSHDTFTPDKDLPRT